MPTSLRYCLLLAVCSLLATVVSHAEEEGYEDLGRPMLGVVMTPPSTRDLRRNDLDARTGVVIRRVYDNTAAQDMGLQAGDIVTEINGVTIDSMSTLREVIQSYVPGDEVHVRGLRQGESLNRDGFLGDWPESVPFREINAQAEDRYRRMTERRLERQAAHLERLRQQEQDLRAEVEALQQQNSQGVGHPATERTTQSPQNLASRVLGGALGGDSSLMLQAPHWRFSYGLQVEAAALNSPRQATPSAASPSSASYAFSVSDQLL